MNKSTLSARKTTEQSLKAVMPLRSKIWNCSADEGVTLRVLRVFISFYTPTSFSLDYW